MFSKILGFFAPWAPAALKFLPWLLLALFIGLWMYRGQEITVANGKTALAQSTTDNAKKECQLEAQTAAATSSAVAAASTLANEQQSNTITGQVIEQRQSAAAVQIQAADAFSDLNIQIDKEAADPSKDGPIPPVLAEQFP